MEKLSIQDLLSELGKAKKVTENESQPQLNSLTEEFLVSKQKKVENFSKAEHEMMKRSSNYKATQEDMDKWVGIIKINR